MTLIDALEAIETAPLGKARLQKIKEVDSTELRTLLNFAISGDITFGMKILPEAVTGGYDRFSDDAMWWRQLRALLVALSGRDVVGDEARDQVARFFSRCDTNQLKWSQRVILQDLRLSIGSKDVNKALGEMVVRVFSIPLAKPFKDLKSLKGKWALQLKMDGARVVAEIASPDNIKLLSRTGKEWGPSFNVIKDAVRHIAEEFDLRNVVLDGEVAIWKKGRMDFQEMQRMFFPKDGRAPNGKMVYTIFDYAPIDEYYEPTKLTYGSRLENLHNTLGNQTLGTHVELIESGHLTDPDQAHLDQKAEDFVRLYGCDGAIIRRLDKVPTNRKSSDITKVKPFEDGEAFVRGKVEGKGHLVGSLGTMVCEFIKDKKPTGIMFEIGTGEGLTKDVRQELWNDADLDKKVVNFKFQRLTDDGVPLLPTYRGLRSLEDM
jgi:ATP-dependent DNA ligase